MNWVRRVEPIIMSAGELEHEWAGTPGRLIRERYRKAAEVSRVRGKLSCLLINDIDAGIGRFSNTQVLHTTPRRSYTMRCAGDSQQPDRGWNTDESLRRSHPCQCGRGMENRPNAQKSAHYCHRYIQSTKSMGVTEVGVQEMIFRSCLRR